MRNWTDEQKDAIYSKWCDDAKSISSNILVNAAAGSGKTAVLVERIINKLCCDKNSPDFCDIRNMLVVTFTNAAAKEMKQRISDALNEKFLQAIDDNDIVFAEHIKNQIKLINLSDITTIDAFCLKIVRNYFHLLNIDPDFKIADGAECEMIKDEVIEELFEEEYSKESFVNLALRLADSRDISNLGDIIRKLYNYTRSLPSPDEWLSEKKELLLSCKENNVYFKTVKDEIFNKINTAKCNLIIALKEMIEEVMSINFNLTEKEIIDIISMNPPEEENDIYYCFGTYYLAIYNDFMFCKSLLEIIEWDKMYQLFGSLEFIRLNQSPKFKNKDLLIKDKNILDPLKNRRDYAKELIIDAKNLMTGTINEIKDISVNEIYPMICKLVELCQNFSIKYSDKKRERNIMEFSDIEHLCLKVINENIDVQNEMKEKYSEILIDEYQDTNALQETIFSKISNGNNLFMVGDMKQSIYRFRSSDPEIFKRKSDTYIKEKNAPNRKIILSKNFRSRDIVLQSINSVFNGIMSEKVGEINYDKDQRLNCGDTTYIDKNIEFSNGYKSECIVILSKSEEDDDDDLTSAQLEARFIANKIKELKDNNFLIRDKRKIKSTDEDGKVIESDEIYYRPIQNKDIAILMSSHKNVASIYQEELSSVGIDCYSQSSGYFEKTEITLALSLLKMINNPYNDIPLIAVMRSPVFSFSDDELCEIRFFKQDCFYNSLKAAAEFSTEELKKKCIRFCENIKRWREYKKIMPCDKLIWTLYEETGLYSFCEAVFGEDAAANLRLLFIRARMYEDSGYKGLFNFIRYINKLQKREEDLSSAVSLGENSDVVRLMTIHKSKGLEFPVVFLAGTSKKFQMLDSRGKILFHKDLGIASDYINLEDSYHERTLQKNAISLKISQEAVSEESRKLYVGMTRAKEKLFVTSVCKRKNVQEFETDAPVELGKWESMCDINGVMAHSTAASVNRYIDWIAPIALIDKQNWNFQIIPYSDVKKSELIYEFINNDINTENSADVIISHNEYQYEISTQIPAKISVTGVNQIGNNSIVNDLAMKPEFLTENSKLTGAQKGTILHYIMQKFNPEKEVTIEEVENFISELIANEEITLTEANSISPVFIVDFYKSEIGKRILKSKRVYKEAPFEIEINISDITDIVSKEKVILQGIIDCYFYEDDEIVLVDFKSDYYDDIEEIKEKYRQQLHLYAHAIEKITTKKVKNKFLYLFSTKSMIQY